MEKTNCFFGHAVDEPDFERGTPKASLTERKRWERLTGYNPFHNGVESPLLAHMQNAYPFDQKKKLRDGDLIHEEVESQRIGPRVQKTDRGVKIRERNIILAVERAQRKADFKKYKE